MLAVRAAHASKALVEIPTPEEGRHGACYDGTPESVFGLKTLVIDLLEGLEMLVHHTPQIRGLRIAWTVQG